MIQNKKFKNMVTLFLKEKKNYENSKWIGKYEHIFMIYSKYTDNK